MRASLHRYTYVYGRSITFTDPSGHDAWPTSPAVLVPSAIAGAMIMSATMGIITAATLSIVDQSGDSTQELNDAMVFFATIIGVSSAFLYLQTALGVAVRMGLLLTGIGAGELLSVIINPGYTWCEKTAATLFMLTGMLFATIGALFADSLSGNVLGAGSQLGLLDYLLISVVNLIFFGVTFWSAGQVLGDLGKPYGQRGGMCQRMN
jgi:hypothetical protein